MLAFRERALGKAPLVGYEEQMGIKKRYFVFPYPPQLEVIKLQWGIIYVSSFFGEIKAIKGTCEKW